MPVSTREFGAGTSIHFAGRCDVEQNHGRDAIRMIQTHPMRHPRTPIMGTNQKPFMSQTPHYRDDVIGHSAF